MRKSWSAPVGVAAALLLAAMMLAAPVGSAVAGADGSDGPVANVSKKKKCKKKGKKKCKKKRKAAAWKEGRYSGTYAESNANLFFNVVGGRLFTGPFDAFYIEAKCYNTDPTYIGPQVTTDASAIEPVQASIAANGSFSGSGVYVPGGGKQIAWTISGQISGTTITGGTFSVSYTDFYGDPCSGTTHFNAVWYGDYTL